MFKSYIDPVEGAEAKKRLPRLMVEGLLLGGSGLGVLALIFEIAADAFSVAAYQTLLAIHGAEGYHEIAIYAFIVLSALLFLGIVPAYKAGAYLRPNAGGSGPLVEAIGPPKMRWLSWIGSSLFFLDAILTIIISSISAADVLMLIYPELAPYRIALAEVFAFFIMAVLVIMGPKRAVPLFLIGGGAFTIFTIGALGMVAAAAVGNPEWAFLTNGIVNRLEASGVVEHVVRAREDLSAIGSVVFFQLFFRSMSSAMLGFSGYEVIPASGKHAARPKWKVINTALTVAAIFLISTGVVQLLAANSWKIPATEGYSTLLIEYEIVAAQTLGNGVDPDAIVVTEEDILNAENMLAHAAEGDHHGEDHHGPTVDEVAQNFALDRAIVNASAGTIGETFLFVAGALLCIILLLAQGGGYIGGAAVAANAARLGRLPASFSDDRVGIAVIWFISALLIPVIREVVIVEAYYAFGFVSAFIITSTTVFLVRDQSLIDRGIEPGSAEAKSLKFAGLRGMIASYFMGIVLITQKSDALIAIVVAGTIITLYQLWIANGKLKRDEDAPLLPVIAPRRSPPKYLDGTQQAHDEARQRGVVDAFQHLAENGKFHKFNIALEPIQKLVAYLYGVDLALFQDVHDHHDKIEEPSDALQATYDAAHNDQEGLLRRIEDYSHYGIFTFIHNFHINWVDPEHGRDVQVVQQAFLDMLFPQTPHDEIWEEYQNFTPQHQPEEIWQFCRERYAWAKDQWPNLSDRITTIWTLQDLGLLSKDINVETVMRISGGQRRMMVKIPTHIDDQTYVGDTEKKALDSDDEEEKT